MPKNEHPYLPVLWLSLPFPHLCVGHTPGTQVALSLVALGRVQPLPGGSVIRFQNSYWSRHSSHLRAFLHPRLFTDRGSSVPSAEATQPSCLGFRMSLPRMAPEVQRSGECIFVQGPSDCLPPCVSGVPPGLQSPQLAPRCASARERCHGILRLRLPCGRAHFSLFQ